MPSSCRHALDVGCGEGILTRQLAFRCKAVTGIDLDPIALAAASASPALHQNVSFLRADAMTHDFPPASFDFIAAVATLHYLPLRDALGRFKDLLAPGGVLAVIGLYRANTFTDHLIATVALPASLLLRLVRPWAHAQVRLQAPQEG